MQIGFLREDAAINVDVDSTFLMLILVRTICGCLWYTRYNSNTDVLTDREMEDKQTDGARFIRQIILQEHHPV